MNRAVLLVGLLVCLVAASASPAAAMPHGKRTAKACKPRARATAVARPTPIRVRETRKRAAVRRAARRRCARLKARRRAVAPRAPSGAPGAPVAGSAPAGGSAPALPAPGTPEPALDTAAPLPPSNPFAVQVVSGEFFLRLSKPEVHAGDVRVEFNNITAEDPHDLHLMRTDATGAVYSFGELQSGQVEAKTLRLNVGTWQLFCALPQHAERGMSAKLRVVAG